MTAPGAGEAADRAILRNASAMAVVTLSAYVALRDLPVGAGDAAVPAVRDHLVAGVGALEAARDALAAAVEDAGGAGPIEPDPRYAPIVEQVLPTVRGPGDVVGLALTLDDVLAQTATRAVVELSTPSRRRVAVAVATAGAARKARLLIVQSLLVAGGAPLAVVPPDLEALPGGVGVVGFPDVRFPTAGAAAVAPGAAR